MVFNPTPLFQLNLMIFLSWRSVPAFVRPVLRDAGWELFRIGQTIPTEIPVRLRVTNATPPIPFQLSSAPDLLLRHDTRLLFLPLECKVNSFGPDRDEARQACALLSLSGQYMAQFFGLTTPNLWKTILLYAVTATKESAMLDTLLQLSSGLNIVGVEASAVGTVGIAVKEDGVHLVLEPRSAQPILELGGPLESSIKVMELDEGVDPRPLYIIPLDPDWRTGDEYEKRALEERVRVALVSIIGSQLEKEEFEIETDSLMRKTIEVWDFWKSSGAKEHLKNAIKAYAREIFKEIGKMGVEIAKNGNQVTFRGITQDKASKIRHYLTSSSFRKGRIDLWSTAVQLDFSRLGEGW